MKFTSAMKQSFWNKVDRSGGENTCWNWKGTKYKQGYGYIRMQKKNFLAHRIALELSGVGVQQFVHVLHSCDNPPCCNPKHLHVGNHLINMNECELRNRRIYLKGEEHPNSKLTDIQAIEIKALYSTGNYSQRALAKHFNVDQNVIFLIVNNKSRKFLNETLRTLTA